jgi:hypothetical protein
MADEIDLLAEINEAVKEYEVEPELPPEPEATAETETSEEVPKDEVKSEAPKADVDVDALVASKIKEVEDKYGKLMANRVDLSQVDPDTYFEKTGQDKELFFKRELYARAKDGSPLKEQLKKDLSEYESKSEITKLRAEMAAKERAEESRKYIETYRNTARDYVTKLDEKVAPTMSKFVKSNESDWVIDELMSEVSRDAQERFAKGDTGDPLTPEQALKRLESKYARFAKVFATAPTAPDKKAVKPKSDVIVKTPPVETEDVGSKDWIDKMLKEAEIEFLREVRKAK